MSIWFDKDLDTGKLENLGNDTMVKYLGLEWLEPGEDFLRARIPVDHRTVQIYGILHGGASCFLAETLGSAASAMVVDHSKFLCVGLEINANHIRSVRKGYVTGVAKPVHLGGTTHVWDIKLYDDEERLTCISRLTVMIIPRKT